MSYSSEKHRAGNSIRSLAKDLLLDVGAKPESLPRGALLDDGGFVFFLGAIFREQRLIPRGIIHLGGNIGQEAIPYMMLGFEKVLFVEANPEIFPRLIENVRVLNQLDDELSKFLGTGSSTQFAAVQAAVGEHNGETKFYVTGSDLFCSTLKPNDFSEWVNYMLGILTNDEAAEFRDWARNAVKVQKEITVRAITLDHLLSEMAAGGWAAGEFNVLSMNIQGGEVSSLRGASSALKSIELIVTEKNYAEHYLGNALAKDLDEFMLANNFVEIASIRAASVGTSVYVRKN